MEHEIELQIMPSGNIAVYRGNGFIPTEQLTEEEKEFIIDRIADELGVNTKGDRETFAEHYGCLPEPEYTEEDLEKYEPVRLPTDCEIHTGWVEERDGHGFVSVPANMFADGEEVTVIINRKN